MIALTIEDGYFVSATIKQGGRETVVRGKALVAAAGGFEANIDCSKQYWNETADNFLIRGTPFNRGDVLRMLLEGNKPSGNMFAAGEIMAWNVLGKGYLAGIGMTIGAVFGRLAGEGAVRHAQN